MPSGDDSASTMRIKLHSDFIGETLAAKQKKRRIRQPRAIGTPPSTIARNVRPDRSMYEELLQSVYDAVLITDEAGIVKDFNSRAVDFFLCREDELTGARVTDLIGGAGVSLLDALVENLKNQRYTVIDAYCVRFDNSQFPAEIAVNRVNLNSSGRLCFFIRDISVRKGAQDALEEAVARLEAHDRARSQFVSNVSHELRTPLTSMIYAVTNMLRGVLGPVPDGIREYLQILQGDCKRLLGTVNDILDLRKIERSRLTLIRSRVPFSRLVMEVMDTLQAQIRQKSLGLSISAADSKAFVHCDVQKMERVILNVMDNAIKYTPEGGDIDVITTCDMEREGHVLLRICDTGVGIPPEAVSRVTERYFTVGEQPRGCGLGLAISKEIIELHGGSITVISPPPDRSKGTMVEISIPTIDPPRVLVVEDESLVRDVIKRQLAAKGYRCAVASTGVEALEAVRAEHPDVVILDLVMPEMEGTELILKLKASRDTMKIPIIVLTGLHIEKSRSELLNSFSIPALVKPWNEKDLLDCVATAVLSAAALNSQSEAESEQAGLDR